MRSSRLAHARVRRCCSPVSSPAKLPRIVRALTSFYFAAAMFALGTLTTIAGAAVAEIQNAPILNVVIGGAAMVGAAGFLAFVMGASCLVVEARVTARMISREARMAFAGGAKRPPQGNSTTNPEQWIAGTKARPRRRVGVSASSLLRSMPQCPVRKAC